MDLLQRALEALHRTALPVVVGGHALVEVPLGRQVVLQLDDTVAQGLAHGPLLGGDDLPVLHGLAGHVVLLGAAALGRH